MGHWMPYVSGGFASSSFSYRANTAAPLAVEDGRTRNDGWYAGIGFDMVVAPGWVTGLEYRHYDFGDVSHDERSLRGRPSLSQRSRSPQLRTPSGSG